MTGKLSDCKIGTSRYVDQKESMNGQLLYVVVPLNLGDRF